MKNFRTGAFALALATGLTTFGAASFADGETGWRNQDERDCYRTQMNHFCFNAPDREENRHTEMMKHGKSKGRYSY